MVEEDKIVEGTFHPFVIPADREIVDCDKLSFPWNQDHNGYFLVKIEGDVIKIGFLVGDKMILELYGKDPYRIMKEITRREIVNQQHVSYISTEITRAWQCIKTGEEFVQR